MAGFGIASGIKNREIILPAILLFLAAVLAGCVRPNFLNEPSEIGSINSEIANSNVGEPSTNSSPAAEEPQAAAVAPEHTVLLGETLATIAEQYGTTAEALMIFNDIKNSNVILPGKVLRIPPPELESEDVTLDSEIVSSEILNDHDLVYGPGARNFNLEDFVGQFDGYLVTYEEEVEDQQLNGAAIVQLVADRHSVDPRLLLAALEYNAGWLTNQQPADVEYMMGHKVENLEGLYKQLSWAANMLNLGFYGRSEGGISGLTVGENDVPYAPEISDGTAGVQYYLASRDNVTLHKWQNDLGPDGFRAVYTQLFGDPLEETLDPLLPEGLEQPILLLPWGKGETWHFTGGPHGGWNTGSAWAALDFVPPDVEYGCAPSDSWVTAVADGIVTRSGYGAVVLDLDGDGDEGSGWAVTYMHLDNHERIAEGSPVVAGDPLGHSGCEGGFANGTHLHLARTYNGRWISADGSIPFNLSGWISSGVGYEYNGWLERNGETKTADVYTTDDNAITAE